MCWYIVLNYTKPLTNLRMKISRLFAMVTVLLAATAVNVMAQNLVKGKVVDKSGQPIIGAAVYLVENPSKGAVTDLNGAWSLEVDPGSTLHFSSIGYRDQDVKPGNQTVLNVILEEDVSLLEEVVVVGYGTQKKVNMTGAVSAVNVDDKMTGRSLSNVSTGLSGLVPGLQVTNTTSMAGKDGASLMIRGLGTVNTATPLVVVDGMPDVDINRINFADVESISVLKDAASASVYGSRAANGVILITTKTGKNSDRTSINFNASVAMETPTRAYDFLDDYPRALTLHQFAASNSTKRESYNFKDGTIDQWLAMGMIDPLRFPNTDWYDVYMRTGILQNYTLSASGGNEKSNFYISLGLMDKAGVQINNDYRRYNTRFNYDYKVLKNVTVGARFDGNWTDFSFTGYADGITNNDTSDSGGGDMQYAIAGVTPYDPISGRYGGVMAYGEDLQAYNPYAFFHSRNRHQTRQNVNGNMYIDWEIIKGLVAHTDYSLSFMNYFAKSADTPTGAAYNFQTGADLGRNYVADNTSVSDTNTTNYKTQWNARLNYNFNLFDTQDFALMFNYSEEYWHQRTMSASRNDRLHPTITELDGALTNVISNSGSSYAEGLRSYVGRFNYTGWDKYLFEFNFRVDGSSRFADGYRFGFFPSVAFGWRFTEESFIKPITQSWLENGKFRISWGKTGNNSGVGRYEQQETLAAANYMTTEVVKGFVNKKMINQELSWEESNVFNVGLDLGFLKNRLRAEIDYYDRLTSGMNRPSEMSIHLSGAYTAPRKNIGDMRNRGVELNLTWRDHAGDFNYSINFNGAYNKTTLEKWNEFLSRGWVFIGMPYHFLYNYESIGIAQTWQDIYDNTPQSATPGQVLIKDLNGDGIIDGKDRKAYPNIQRDRPTTTFGLTLTAAWKGLDIVALFNGAAGRKDVWYTDFNKTNPSDKRFNFQQLHWNDTWSLENRDARFQRLGSSPLQTPSNSVGVTDWLYDMSYLRLKNLQIGYSFPKRWISKVGMHNARLYLSAENLFTLTKYPGLDPEKPFSARDLYPINKSYSVGINIGF